jgi:hypothetical protein
VLQEIAVGEERRARLTGSLFRVLLLGGVARLGNAGFTELLDRVSLFLSG